MFHVRIGISQERKNFKPRPQNRNKRSFQNFHEHPRPFYLGVPLPSGSTSPSSLTLQNVICSRLSRNPHLRLRPPNKVNYSTNPMTVIRTGQQNGRRSLGTLQESEVWKLCKRQISGQRSAIVLQRSPILIQERKRNPGVDFLMVIMASCIARGRVRTTATTATELPNMAAILQIIS